MDSVGSDFRAGQWKLQNLRTNHTSIKGTTFNRISERRGATCIRFWMGSREVSTSIIGAVGEAEEKTAPNQPN
jgi:hypothetical protein